MQHEHFRRRSISSRSRRDAHANVVVPALVVGAAALALLAAAVPRPADDALAAHAAHAVDAVDAVGTGQDTTRRTAAHAAAPDFACDVRRVATGASRADIDAAAPGLPSGLEPLLGALHGDGGFGRPRGDGFRVECLDGGTAVTWRFDLEDIERRRTLDGGTLISAFEARHTVEAPRDARLTAGSIVAETVSLPAPSAWRPTPDGEGLVALLEARRAGAGGGNCTGALAGGCSVARDIVWELRPAGRAGIVLEQRIWVNGLAAERAVWRLDG